MCNSAQINHSVRDKSLLWLPADAVVALLAWSEFIPSPGLLPLFNSHSDPVSYLFAELKPVQAAKPQTFSCCRFSQLFPRI